jgi:hypothetical protein
VELPINDEERLPIILRGPTNQSVREGLAATFSILANALDPLTYQWRKNGIDIPGANQSEYTTPPTKMADDQSMYLCVVKTKIGSATSSQAVLRVVPAQGEDRPAVRKNIVNVIENGTMEIAFSRKPTAPATIYDRRGRLVFEIRESDLASGIAHWDGRNEAGEVVSAGLYFLVIPTNTNTQKEKIIVLY